MAKAVKKIGIIGTGQMGVGIAEAFLKQSYLVFLHDHQPAALQNAEQKIKVFFEKQFEKQKAEAPPLSVDDAMQHIYFAPDIEQLSQCDLVIEAATENFAVKAALLERMSQHLGADALLVTNTSSLSLNALAKHVKLPQQFMGMHFMNPVPVIPLVELIKADQTADQTVETIARLVESLGKTAVHSTDSPGFIVNRILIPMVHEAIVVLETGVGSAADIDAAMRLGTNQPMGPLALADLIGLDTCLAIMQTLHNDLKSDKYKPCELLVSMVKQGFLGRKTKKGFYEY